MSIKSRIGNLFGRKKAAPEQPERAVEEAPAAAVAEQQPKEPEARAVPAASKPKKRKKRAVVDRPACSTQRVNYILRRAHVSEKTVDLANKMRQHTFEVAPDATREEVKVAAEQLMGVKVSEVRISNVHGKRKRNGTRSSWRKALIMLEPGQDLDMMEAGS